MGRRRKFENRFEIIVETAAALFTAKGPQNTTMEEIARQCDLGKATLYAEFESKEELMNAVIVRHMQEAERWMRARAMGATGHYMATLHSILIDRIMGIYDHANQHFHTAEMMEVAQNKRDGGEKIRCQWDQESRVFAELMEKAAANGEMPSAGDYFYKARMLRKALTGLLPPYVACIARDAFECDLREIVSVYLAGLKNGG